MSSKTTTTTTTVTADYDGSDLVRSDVSLDNAVDLTKYNVMFPGGKVNNYGLGELYEHGRKYILTWKDLDDSALCFYGCMTVANNPGIFNATGKTKSGKTATDLRGMSPELIKKLPQLDGTNAEIKKSIQKRLDESWGDLALVNHRVCTLVWFAAIDAFYGKNISDRVDNWVKSYGSLDEWAKKTKPTEAAQEGNKALKTEAITIQNIRMVTEWRSSEGCRKLKAALESRLIPYEYEGEQRNKWAIVVIKRTQKAKAEKAKKGKTVTDVIV